MDYIVRDIKDPLLSSVFAIFDLSQIKIPQTPKGGGIRSSDVYRRVGMAIMGFWSDSQFAHARAFLSLASCGHYGSLAA